MRLQVFLPPGPEGDGERRALQVVLAAYPNLFATDFEPPRALLRGLWLAALHPDADAGLGPGAGDYYGDGEEWETPDEAVALHDRVALLPARRGSGAPRAVRPGIWQASFSDVEALRAGFGRALRAALTDLRAEYQALEARRPGIPVAAAAPLLEVTEAALSLSLDS
jgi:hypothetical protein